MAAHEMKAADYKIVSELPGNDKCIDCGARHPEWGSISFGILFCASCSGGHRSLGTHISRVRSVKMDSWTNEQVERMKRGGNQQCQDFLKSKGLLDFDAKTIRQRYDSPPAELYKMVLDARIAGQPEPTELPQKAKTTTTNNNNNNNNNNSRPIGGRKKMEGFGSGPPPGQEQREQVKRGAKLGAYVVAGGFVLWYMANRDGHSRDHSAGAVKK